MRRRSIAGAQFTWFTGTKVQILTHLRSCRPFAMPGGGINVTVRAVGVLPGYRDSQISPALFALGVDSLSGGRVQLQVRSVLALLVP
jgi:hypothetical protein